MLWYEIKQGEKKLSASLVSAIPNGRRLRLILLGSDFRFYEFETDLFVCNRPYTSALDPGNPAGHQVPVLTFTIKE